MRALIFIVLLITSTLTFGQSKQSDLGAWYMYFWQLKTDSKWGLQGDLQSRNWSLATDMEQIMLRGGATYQANANILLTQGYGHIISGEKGDSKATYGEHRIYQEVLISDQPSSRLLLKHRFRFEQRWVEKQNFRTRYRYALFLNVPLNAQKIEQKTVYLALYNELFINGQRSVSSGKSTELFDRNRAYAALGYGLLPSLNLQLGIMNQTTSKTRKNQIQLSLHHSF